MPKKSPGQKTAEHLAEMIEEAVEIRINALENIMGLLGADAHEAILAILVDRGVTRFLLEDEISLLRLYVKKAKGEDSRLN